MFGHKLSSIPNQNYRVDSHPTIEQLGEMMDKARSLSGIRHNYLWELPKEFKKYTLSLHCKEAKNPDAEIDWWLHEENVVGTKMLWFHKTKDIAVIYPHILQAVGAKHPLEEETPEEKAKREREKEKPTSLGERLKRSTSSAELIAAPTMEEEEAAAAASVQPDAGHSSIMRLMSGNLKLRPIAWLLQTAAQSELTGELRVEGQGRTVIVQFGLGRPVHAATANKVGTEAVLELFAWSDGTSSFTEGKQPDTASVQDSTDEILKQGSKMLEALGYLNKHNMDENSVLSRPPIGLSEEQLEQRLKDGVDYGFKIQRAFYRALDGNLKLREVGEQISLDTSRLLGVAVNFLKLGLILTPDGRSLRQVASSAAVDAFAQQLQQAQSGAQPALKPPAGFFGGGGGGGEAPQTPGFGGPTPGFGGPTPGTDGQQHTGEFGRSNTGETAAPLQPPKFVFGQSSGDTTSGAFPQPSQESSGRQTPLPFAQQSQSGRQPALPASQEQSGQQTPLQTAMQELSGRHESLKPAAAGGANSALAALAPQHRDFFEVGVPSSVLPYDEASVQAVQNALTNPQTGALIFPAFQLLLEREFARAFRFSSEFSLLIFCIRLGGGPEGSTAPANSVLPMQSLALATQAVSTIKRDVDIFGHVGDKSFGLILPGVGANQSCALVERICADLPKLAPKLGGYWPILHFGIAGVPQDARDLPSLMKSAQEAMIEAASKNYTRIRCSDMS